MRALISIYDKTGLDVFARGLDELGWELVASGGTASYLAELGLSVERVEALTDFPEMLGGRVKTLHPRIHAGILARRDDADDLATLSEHEIEPFDLVCVNLYPFEEVASKRGVDRGRGGRDDRRRRPVDVARRGQELRARRTRMPAGTLRLRARRVAGTGHLTLETRRELAAEAFATTAAYEAAIATWFSARESFPRRRSSRFEKVLDLAYGENPHQRAAYYAERGTRSHLLSRVEQLNGKALSFNNLNDLSAARLLAREFALPVCVIVKHANPCGVAMAATIDEAYDKALAADPPSAFGGVVVVNREVDGPLGEKLAEQFIEVLFAPGYDEAALQALRAAAGHARPRGSRAPRPPVDSRDYKRVLGGLLVQDPRRRHRGPRGLAGRLPARRTSGSGAISSSPGACASTCPRTRSCSRRISPRSASARAR